MPPHASNRWAINIELPRLSGWGSSGSAGYPFRITLFLAGRESGRRVRPSIHVNYHAPHVDEGRALSAVACVADDELLTAAREELAIGEAVGEVVR